VVFFLHPVSGKPRHSRRGRKARDGFYVPLNVSETFSGILFARSVVFFLYPVRGKPQPFKAGMEGAEWRKSVRRPLV
jgi:hypothetical protein